MKPIQAIGLVSGGLDSMLAMRLILDQELSVEAVHVVLPVHRPGLRTRVLKLTDQLGVPLHIATLEEEFFEIVRRPRHGYGGGMNPCIDCHVLMLRVANERMRQVGASFVFTGEVLGERPVSQGWESLVLVERKSGLKGRLLRPLSARLLPPTIPEQEGLVDRSRLLDLEGRTRKRQLALARQYGFEEIPWPGGGCILTDAALVRRVRDLVDHKHDFSSNDFSLVRLGRHFRLSPEGWAVSGRNESENERIAGLAQEGDLLFEAQGFGSPVTLLRGVADEQAIRLAAAITSFYSDADTSTVVVHYGPSLAHLEQTVAVEPIEKVLLEQLRI